mmetsp:Transcript_16509/g.23094  ORF Transcript_16509/g.23094 Transcript_16509/m.23094 type:complete len:672 (+) Transcript_16509:218-2233(+)|eukprot:CAMPEP_0184489296 /NCGR_PEP_ID=MMETSP0113_2-20130426/14981_1 /TAXON_ID=91329 /ORGANISM="Norrisiella sphaerica, Strain BC52" /LENGTH=671 /DNA_ID=CAMNT_0026872619 /DNA_START=119 /DNA_END=2134 /DNA_ORIENTATION=+
MLSGRAPPPPPQRDSDKAAQSDKQPSVSAGTAEPMSAESTSGSNKIEATSSNGIESMAKLDANLDEAELPVPPPAPSEGLPEPPIFRKPEVFVCVANPGLGYRRETKWDSKVDGKGVAKGEKVEGEEETKGWILIRNKNLYLPVEHNGQTLLQKDKSLSDSRTALLNDIKRAKGGRNIGARAKLLSEISKGKALKKAQLRDVGNLGVDSKVMQEAIVKSIISYDQAIQLWKFLQSACPKVRKPSHEKRSSVMEYMQIARKRYSQKDLATLVRKMKEKLKPKTKTYVKKKYYNCISGAEIIFYLGESKMCSCIGESEAIGTILLNDGLLRPASAKKINNVKGLPVRADHFYRYGDISLHAGFLERRQKNVFNASSYKKRYYRLVECAYGSKSKRQEYRLDSYIKSIDKDVHSSLDVTDAIIDPSPKLALEFSLKSSKELRLKAATQEAKKSWVDVLKKVLGSDQTISDLKKRTFGTRLSQVMKSQRNPMIPKIVWDCVEHIKKYGMTTEGVFRKAGLKDRVNEIKKCFDAAIEVDFRERGDIHNAAACLKQWLRELPEPLVPFDKYKAFLDASSPPEYHSLVEQIPKQNQELLAYLCSFLERLSLNHEVTRMHTKNLALVFAPNILRPEVEGAMEAFQNSDKKIETFSKIIENVYDIFGLKKPQDLERIDYL